MVCPAKDGSTSSGEWRSGKHLLHRVAVILVKPTPVSSIRVDQCGAPLFHSCHTRVAKPRDQNRRYPSFSTKRQECREHEERFPSIGAREISTIAPLQDSVLSESIRVVLNLGWVQEMRVVNRR